MNAKATDQPIAALLKDLKNWNPPPADVLTPVTFGRVASARTMRELQFGLKYIF
jgi:hypothetical protein